MRTKILNMFIFILCFYYLRITIDISLLQHQQQNQRQCTQQEYIGVLLNLSALQTAYLITGGIGTPGKEVEEAVHYVAVEPGDGAGDATEDNLVGDELVYIINVER